MERPTDIEYAYVRRRAEDVYPAVEEYWVAAPSDVATKTRYGLEWFEHRWQQALDGTLVVGGSNSKGRKETGEEDEAQGQAQETPEVETPVGSLTSGSA